MAGILEYSSNRTNNTAINGIGIAGSDSVKNGNDAIQQLMADAKSAVMKIVDKAAGSYTAVKADYNQLWRVTGTATINLTAAATLSDGWCLWVMADGATATIDPAGSEKINGADTLALSDGNAALIICTATDFRAIIFNAPFDASTLLPKSGGTMTGLLTLAPSDDDPDGTASLNIPAGADAPDMQADGDLWADSNEDLRYRRGGVDARLYDSVNLPRPAPGEMAAGIETAPRALSAADVRAAIWTELAPVPTTSGTAIDFTSIPAGVTDIELWFASIGASGDSQFIVQIGSGGAPATTGYSAGSGLAGAPYYVTSTAGFTIYRSSFPDALTGSMRIKRHPGSNLWISSHAVQLDTAGLAAVGGGSVTLSGALDNMRLRATNGTDAFDAGSVQVRYR